MSDLVKTLRSTALVNLSMPTTLLNAADRIEELEAENERLLDAMFESYEPGCECACCEIVRTMDAAVQEDSDE